MLIVCGSGERRRKRSARNGIEAVRPEGIMPPDNATSVAPWRGLLHRGEVSLAQPCAVVGEDEVGDARRDLGAETRAVEHAVMADPVREVMCLARRGDVAAEPV